MSQSESGSVEPVPAPTSERTCGFCNVQTMTNPCHHCKALDLMVALKESIANRAASPGGEPPTIAKPCLSEGCWEAAGLNGYCRAHDDSFIDDPGLGESVPPESPVCKCVAWEAGGSQRIDREMCVIHGSVSGGVVSSPGEPLPLTRTREMEMVFDNAVSDARWRGLSGPAEYHGIDAVLKIVERDR